MPMIRARPVMRAQALMPKMFGEYVMVVVIPANAPIAMSALTAGSVASLNFISMREAHGGGGV